MTTKGTLRPRTHTEVFGILEKGTRKDVKTVVEEQEVSLGMIDPTSGRSLLYKILTTITNGDKLVLDKLDACISTTGDDPDDDDWAVTVSHRCLVDEDQRSMTVVNDLLHLPNKIAAKVLRHPVVKTFIERRWKRTRSIFLVSFFLYLTFVLLFSSFVWLMYQRDGRDVETVKVQLPAKCDKLRPVDSKTKPKVSAITSRIGPLGVDEGDGDDDDLIDVTLGGQQQLDLRFRGPSLRSSPAGDEEVFFEDFTELSLEVKKTRKVKKSRANRKLLLFASCRAKWKKCKKCPDVPLCAVEICLVLTIIILLSQELWQWLALGWQYVHELENWFEWTILALAITSLGLKHDADLDSLKIVSSIGICLAWIELIFLFGRYPFLSGKFSIMYYSITKRIVKAAFGFIILIVAFTFAFFIIHFNNETESFDDLFRSFLKVFVMTLGEFEFDELWTNSHPEDGSDGYSRHFTMLLLVLLIVFGTVTMVNLIIAIIITDIQWLQSVSRDQVLLHQAHHVVTIHALITLFRWIVRRKVSASQGSISSSNLGARDPISVDFCLHSVCKCGKERPNRDTREELQAVVDKKKSSKLS